MASKLPLFTLIDIGTKEPFLWQAYYWVIADKNDIPFAIEEDLLMIFSNQERADYIAEILEEECFVKVLFWEQLAELYGEYCMEAIVNHMLIPDPECVRLFLEEDIFQNEEESEPAYA